MRILAAQLNPTIGDVEGNAQKVISALDRARRQKADVVVFPELTLSGYCPDDLLLDSRFIDAIFQKLEEIVPHTKGLFAAIGLPRSSGGKKEKLLYNSVAVCADGKLLGFKNKTLLPTYDVFDERRYFEPGEEEILWEYMGRRIAVTICEDVWQHAKSVGYTHYARDPVLELKEKRPDLVLNLSGSPYSYGRNHTRLSVFSKAAKTLLCPLIFCNQVGGNDQLLFDGYSFYLNEKGELIQQAKGFIEDDLIVDLSTHACPSPPDEHQTKDLYSALVLGVKDYFHKQGFKQALLGLSGGIDSALALCIAVDALGSESVLALTLPSRYSSKGSVADSRNLAKNLNVELIEVPIEPIFKSYLDLLKESFRESPLDLTEQNLQSRIRAMILMAYSNQYGALLLNTGNKSELAMGYTTLYGDMAGGFAPLHDVTKRKIYELARFINEKGEIIPQAIIDKAPSAELKPNQKDTDTLPPYEMLDAVIEDYIEERLPVEEIAKRRKLELEFVKDLVHKIHLAEYKRRQAPLSLRVTLKAFNRGRQIPIVQKWI